VLLAAGAGLPVVLLDFAFFSLTEEMVFAVVI
jgi:hypothetical protein